jgi:hypothetical protein
MTDTARRDDVLTALLLLRQTVPGEHPEISEQTAEVWHVALALYPGDVVRHVALHWSGDRFPSREDFREAVSAELSSRRDAAARAALEDPQVERCPECMGRGWVVLDADLWIVRSCSMGCAPPLPIYAQGRVEHRRRRPAQREHRGPSRADFGREVTNRMTGDREF